VKSSIVILYATILINLLTYLLSECRPPSCYYSKMLSNYQCTAGLVVSLKSNASTFFDHVSVDLCFSENKPTYIKLLQFLIPVSLILSFGSFGFSYYFWTHFFSFVLL